MNQNHKVVNWLLLLAVPLAYLLLFFTLPDDSSTWSALSNLQASLNLSSAQLVTFEVLIVILVAWTLLGLMFVVYWLVLKLSSKHQYGALYRALTGALSLTYLLVALGNVLNWVAPSWATGILQTILLAVVYATLSKDYRGTVILVVVALVMNVGLTFI
ncbi:hypothetical protein OZX65_05740 [Leuconostocaceae bacterium ESL0723]|nr:hypothetical protein OZX65_05740 [Leuconostocaceae bacterium ESL0723]